MSTTNPTPEPGLSAIVLTKAGNVELGFDRKIELFGRNI